MRARARLAASIVLVLALGACAARGPRAWFQGEKQGAAPTEQAPEKQAPEKKEEPAKESRPVLWTILMYVPNRILDIFDIARFGVEVGPGIGFDLEVTEALRVAAMTRATVGLGYQTLRHMPIKSAAETYAGVGPIDLGVSPGMNWWRNFWDVRADVQVALVGAHVAVNPAEIADAVLGFFLIDIMDDDF
ncbi:MAG TPA: hypothetical protein VKE69_03995 [Planctomycetota bacterium]|nr:hypothetical protein [Planctomycetota bacterium]